MHDKNGTSSGSGDHNGDKPKSEGGSFVTETEVESLTRRLDHSVPDGDFAPVGTEA
ncbi:hypothetical protein ACFXPX_34615 [Kitasatospora sp. NPDC059146]|uniref:hypothetical protein n=1 Tax=unclassified Kitasatospora TaxID=2633591 RepID=UPI0036A01E5B